MAGAIAHAAQRQRMPAIDEIVPSRDGRQLMATWTHPTNDVFWQCATVDKIQAVTQPLDRSLQQLDEVMQQQAQQDLVQAQQREHEQAQHRGRSL